MSESEQLVQAKLRVRAIATWIPSSIAAIRQLREQTFTPEGATPPDWKADTLAALVAVVGREVVEKYEQLLAQDEPEEPARTYLVELAENLQPGDLC